MGGSSKQNHKEAFDDLIKEKKGAWVDKLLGVLWVYKTTHKTATGEHYLP